MQPKHGAFEVINTSRKPVFACGQEKRQLRRSREVGLRHRFRSLQSGIGLRSRDMYRRRKKKTKAALSIGDWIQLSSASHSGSRPAHQKERNITPQTRRNFE